MSQANPVNEGLIHAWLDGQLPPEDAAYVEQLVATDSEWGAAAAEARGLVAAASRVLGALDDVPRAVPEKPSGRENEKAGAPHDKAKLRAWWHAPWLRAAAGIVLVVGVSSVVWMRRGDVVSNAALKVDDSPAQDANAQRAERTAVSSRDSAPPQAPRVPQGAPGAGPPAELRRLGEADAGGAREVAKSVAEERKTADTIGRRGVVAADVVPVVVPTPPGVEQGVVGATAGDGRAALTGAVRGGNSANVLSLAAKVFDSTSVDPRLAGCWAPVQAARQETFARRDRADEPLTLPSLMRFINPVATDVAAAAPASPVPPRSTAVQGAAVAARQASPVMAEAAPMRAAVNATVTRAPARDSAFVAEWVDQDTRRIATFTARGDTLRGTLRVMPGDSTRTTPFVAARTPCAR